MERKYIKSLFVLFLIGMLTLSACNTTNYTQEEVDAKLADLANTHQTKINDLDKELTSVGNDKLSAEADAKDKEVRIAELEADLEDATTETKEAEEPVAIDFLGEEIDDLELGDEVEFSLDDGDIRHLLDTEIDFNGNDYDVHEEFNGENLVIALNGFGYDEEFGGEPYLVLTDEEALTYRYVFDDPVEIIDISDDEPLEIMFLGKLMKIVDVEASELEVEFGTELLLNQGESFTYNDLPLTLIAVSEDEAFISYNGYTEALDEGQSRTVGGLDIKLIEAFESDIGEGTAFATFVIGDEVELTLEDNDEYLDDERFVFNIEIVSDELVSLSLTYDVKSDELDDDEAPLALGEKISFPNDYLTVEFAELTEVDYIGVDISLDEIDAEDDLTSDENGYVLEADEDIIEIDDEEVDELFVLASGLYYFDDENDLVKASDSTATLVNDDFELVVSLVGEVLTFTDDNGDKLELDGDLSDLFLGDEEEEAEADDVTFGGTAFGTQDYDLLTGTGYIVLNVEDNADNDEVKLSLPSDIVEATVLVY